MIIDVDRHATVERYQDLFPHMSLSWRKHFERDEWLESVTVAGDHVRVSDRFVHEQSTESPGQDDDDSFRLLLPHHGLAVNGWADQVAARTFLEALNSYAAERWASTSTLPVVVVSPHDTAWSAGEIRRRAAAGTAGAVAPPLTSTMLGSQHWNPIFEACVETNLPLVVHFSGVEGRYSGAPPLAGGVHASAFSRLTLMPHLAESNIASLTYEGALVRFPELRIIFTGFGFTWLPSLLWRLDREWRTFRHDIPWVTEPPSEQVLTNMWFSTWPVKEATNTEEWEASFTERLRDRVVYGSHSPHEGDAVKDILTHLGGEWATRLMRNGAASLARPIPAGV
ncbi:hypothetical protein Rhow_009039 [Rhodococcus wratislaviensis]|uniref:Amidohydrolase-related domain-containing protein n=1 Tax=Rhodococcus wratislaviensis TaxID=44752 RepID=A0A402CM92_RHOWR|nr:hypothetical protein Rhow_009039 [Rhodococcus wratislaviensis]